MSYTQPTHAYYSETRTFLENHANTVEEVVEALMRDEDYIESVAEKNDYDYDMYDGEKLDEELKQAVAALAPEMAYRMLQDFAETMDRWPEVTDNMRLTKALKSLSPEILAFENFEDCGSCASSLLFSNYQEGKLPPEAKGYVTYHEQSTDRVAAGGDLYLSHSSFAEGYDEAEDLRIAGKVVEALKAEGLNVDWDGSADRTIKISNMRWHRAFPPLVH